MKKVVVAIVALACFGNMQLYSMLRTVSLHGKRRYVATLDDSKQIATVVFDNETQRALLALAFDKGITPDSGLQNYLYEHAEGEGLPFNIEVMSVGRLRKIQLDAVQDLGKK